jgi:hypothetical protein
MKNENPSLTIFSQSNRNSNNKNHSHQLSLPLALDRKPHKPQISSIPGISPKQRDRYHVVLGDEILGDRLTLDEAIALVKGGAS